MSFYGETLPTIECQGRPEELLCLMKMARAISLKTLSLAPLPIGFTQNNGYRHEQIGLMGLKTQRKID